MSAAAFIKKQLPEKRVLIFKEFCIIEGKNENVLGSLDYRIEVN